MKDVFKVTSGRANDGLCSERIMKYQPNEMHTPKPAFQNTCKGNMTTESLKVT